MFDLPIWGYIAVLAITTHITVAGVTLFLHRSATHRSITLHPSVSHFFRFWLWMTTGMITKQWVAVHRRHHATVDTSSDPHSPQFFGIWTVLFRGVHLYRLAGASMEVMRYARDIEEDWLELNVYTPRNFWGLFLLAFIYIGLFGWVGVAMTAIHFLWIPFWAAGVVNGIGHYVGYRNFDTADQSRNFWPVGVLLCGEELHNNHHHDPMSPKFSVKWFEFDVCWLYIKMLKRLGLATLRNDNELR